LRERAEAVQVPRGAAGGQGAGRVARARRQTARQRRLRPWRHRRGIAPPEHRVDPVGVVRGARGRNVRPRGAQARRHRAGDVRVRPPRRRTGRRRITDMSELLLIYTAYSLATTAMPGAATLPVDPDGFMPFQQNYLLWKIIGFAGIGTFG